MGGLLGSIALTSILTGVTEPIEFTFMFLAPALYAVHALLTGLAFIIMDTLHVRLGFGFSAGLFDYVLNYNRATRPLLLLPVGIGYFLLYYTLFRFVILRFDLKTPGRGVQEGAAAMSAVPPAERGRRWLAALGGAGNLLSVDACTTRLRLKVASQTAVDESALGSLGARGMVRPGPQALQVVIGPAADQISGEIRAALAALPGDKARPGTLPAAAAVPVSHVWTRRADELLAALGGRANVKTVAEAGGRLRVSLADSTCVDAAAARAAGARAVAVLGPGCVHVLLPPAHASAAAAALRQLLAKT